MAEDDYIITLPSNVFLKKRMEHTLNSLLSKVDHKDYMGCQEEILYKLTILNIVFQKGRVTFDEAEQKIKEEHGSVFDEELFNEIFSTIQSLCNPEVKNENQNLSLATQAPEQEWLYEFKLEDIYLEIIETIIKNKSFQEFFNKLNNEIIVSFNDVQIKKIARSTKEKTKLIYIVNRKLSVDEQEYIALVIMEVLNGYIA